jgi:ethanolamine transporter EutH
MAFDAGYVFPMIVGKLIAGVTALLLAMPVEKKTAGK